ncbi:MAG: HAD hydrolase family protein, partial [Erysipelotrichaceae bacterium]|nr:HAD hydrolase family protein [Erysipelotrichaceae bacterium]
RNGIPKEEVMVFGDMDNDVGLMEKGGWSVAMLNGCEATKQAADVITEYDCNHDGVGHYLFDHWIIPNGWDK